MNRIGDVVLISLLTVIPSKGCAQNVVKRNQVDSIAEPRHFVRKDSISKMEREVSGAKYRYIPKQVVGNHLQTFL